MGSGKSAVGKNLAEVLGYKFIDLDSYIQNEEGKTITEIFKNKGEIYFRKIESNYLNDVLNLNASVVSLGGGTPCYGTNMDRIKSANNTTSVYLKASVSCLSERLFKEKDHRPIISHISNKNELDEFIGKHLFERVPFYSQSAYTVNTDDKTIDEVVETIVLKLF